jgi:hypothetical protein
MYLRAILSSMFFGFVKLDAKMEEKQEARHFVSMGSKLALLALVFHTLSIGGSALYFTSIIPHFFDVIAIQLHHPLSDDFKSVVYYISLIIGVLLSGALEFATVGVFSARMKTLNTRLLMIALIVFQVATLVMGVKNTAREYAVPNALYSQLDYYNELLKTQQKTVAKVQDKKEQALNSDKISKEDRIANRNKYEIEAIEKDIIRAKRAKEDVYSTYEFAVKSRASDFGVSVEVFKDKYRTLFAKITNRYKAKLEEADKEILALTQKLADARTKKSYLTKSEVVNNLDNSFEKEKAKEKEIANEVKAIQQEIIDRKDRVEKLFNTYQIYVIAFGLFIVFVQGFIAKEIEAQSLMATTVLDEIKQRAKQREYYNKRKQNNTEVEEQKEEPSVEVAAKEEENELSKDAKEYLDAMLHLYNRDKKLPSDAEVADYLGAGWQNKAKRVKARGELLDKEYLATLGTATKPLSKFYEKARLKED